MLLPEKLVFILFPVLFIGIWCVTLAAISHFGWSRLAKRYSAFARPEGTSYPWQSMRLGLLSNYRSCITFSVSRQGIHIAIFPLFGIGHPPLYLQWSQIRFRKEEKGLFGTSYFYDLGTPHGGRMVVGAKIHQAIMRETQNA